MRRGRGQSRWLRKAGAALAVLTAVAMGAPAVQAESNHWGGGTFRLGMSTGGIPTATDEPGKTSWWVSTVSSNAVIWHRDAEASVDDVSVSGSLQGTKENTLGAVGEASLTVSAPASATAQAFSASVSGTYRRTQALFQLELTGTASDGNNEPVPIRVTGSGTWRPTSGDGVVTPIRAADVVMELTLIFPGDVPPPPGPKAASTIDFAGEAWLPTFPCPPPLPGEQPCTGSFTGEIIGTFAGDDGPGLWNVSMIGPVESTFNYADLIQPGAPCLEGVATGVGSVELGQNGVVGVWTNHAGIPELVRGAKLVFNFSWLRVGVTAVLTLTELSLTIKTTGGGGWIEVIEPDSSTAPAVAAFVPDLTEEHLDACERGVPGPSLTAQVDGVASIEGT